MTAASTSPELTGFVVGYRVWRLRIDGVLVSAGAGQAAWRRGVNTAVCPRRRHDAPHERCSCGLYAMHGPPPAGSPGIVGAVRAHGDLQAHRDGFRAAHAEVVALVKRRPRARGRERRAAARYGVALVDLRELERVAGEHGDPLDPTLRPAAQRSLLDVAAADAGVLAGVFAAVGRADRALERGYGAVACRLRRRAGARALALHVVEWVALAALIAGGYLCVSAIAGRHSTSWVFAVTAAAFAVSVAVTATRCRYGSGWMAPVHPWRERAVAAAGIPLALLGPGRLDAGVVDALGWTVCFFVGLMLLGRIVWYHRPRAVAATVAWAAAAGGAVLAGAPVMLAAAVVGVLHGRGRGQL